jgi:hypothetical protein
MATCNSVLEFHRVALGYMNQITYTKIKDGKFELVEKLFDHFSANRKYWTVKLEKTIKDKMEEFSKTMPQIMKYEYMFYQLPSRMDIDE